jgi:endonuclease YncB( thermonuclease family)
MPRVTSAEDSTNPFDDEIGQKALRATFAAFGEDFEPAYDFTNTHERVEAAFGDSREDIPPESIQPWECRIGGSKFFIPPLNIEVSQISKAGSLSGSALRQQTSPKFNTGHSETVINMTLYFASYEEIFGFEDEIFRINFDTGPAELTGEGWHPSDRRLFNLGPTASDDEKSIDRFLSSLRGLIAQFKYAPFLPIRNEYLNRAFGISGVVLKDMSIATVPDYPFTLAVNLTMYKFNHNVYLPMIEHFDQAIHWGRFRQYMGRAASRLAQSSRPIKEFNLAVDSINNSPIDVGEIRPSVRSPSEVLEDVHVRDVPGTQTFRRHSIFESNRFEFYYPVTTPAGIELPDLSDMRYDDIVWNQQRKNWWQRLLGTLGFNVNTNNEQYKKAREMAEEQGTGFVVNQNEAKTLSTYLRTVRVAMDLMGPGELNRYYVRRLREENLEAGTPAGQELRREIESVWFYALYRFFMEDPSLARALANRDRQDRQLTINEWEVPMVRRHLDPDTVKIQGVSVTMGNVIARMQLQMESEPTHQHIGGADTVVNIHMILSGPNSETELVKLRTMFEHISGLSRLEQGHGVLGFLGVRNIITELVGIRYVIPLTFDVSTIEGSPHSYEVIIALTDFDIFQQKREGLGAEQQAELAEAFGKRNPFFRVKQLWGMFNAYPDFPLSVRDAQGKIVGHLDPDFYFRSFKGLDDDIFLSEESQNFVDLRPQGSSSAQIRQSFEEVFQEAEDRRRLDPSHDYLNDSGVHYCVGRGPDGTAEYVSIGPNGFSLYSGKEAAVVDAHFNEPHAGNVLPPAPDPGYEDFTPAPGYVQPYFDGSGDPWFQFDAMAQDMLYRDTSGRMIRAYPSYMLWLIDESQIAGVKMFDNFYGLQSVIDMSIVQSKEILGDTLVLRVSNLYSKLSTKMKDYLDENDPGSRMINEITSMSHRTLANQGWIVDLDTIQLQPGLRLHLRLGYGSNPNLLETVFNGTITEVQNGDVMTIIAQSDAIELGALVNSTNEKGHTGKIDGGMVGLYMSEPRDLMITLLTQGSTTFKEFIAHASQGEIYSENRYGIKHFGSMFYDPLDSGEFDKVGRNKRRLSGIIASVNEDSTNAGEVLGLTSMAMFDVMNAAWVNLAAKRDYEVFKRNIYPGNGTGVSQFLGGDLGEFGLAQAIDHTGSMRPSAGIQGGDAGASFNISNSGRDALDAAVQLQERSQVEEEIAWGGNKMAAASPVMFGVTLPAQGIDNVRQAAANHINARNIHGAARRHNLAQMFGIIRNDTGNDPSDEVAFRAQTYLKTVWDLFQVCAALLPDYIVAVRPFEDRSTVFYGKPHWLYTSGLVPLTTGLPPLKVSQPDDDLQQIFQRVEKELSRQGQLDSFEEFFSGVENYHNNTSGSDPYTNTDDIQFSGGAKGANLAARAAIKAGFTGQDLIDAVAVAGAESDWIADNENPSSNATGLWQIMYSVWGKTVGASRRSDLHDPYLNARAAKMITEGSLAQRYGKWSDWAVHPSAASRPGMYFDRNRDYRKWLDKAEKAVKEELAAASSTTASTKNQPMDGWASRVELEAADKTSDNGPKSGGIDIREATDHDIAADVYNFRGDGNRDDVAAVEIWNEVRQYFATDPEVERRFLRARQLADLPESKRREIKDETYNQIVEDFLNFVYENPYARGWVVKTSNKRAGRLISAPLDTAKSLLLGLKDWVTGQDSDRPELAERKWEFEPLYNAFTQYINFGDAAAFEYMKNNHSDGRDQSNMLLRIFENAGATLLRGWEKTKDLGRRALSAVGGVANGLLQFMRLQLFQMTSGLSMASNMQQQTNALNRVFNDSIYYSEGRAEDGSITNPILYYADNPFTREYAEPVVEIREPFQRLHMVNSFQDIISNSIIETMDEVATVVTATSNGQHPVTVHLDKSAASDKQVEKVVDTGLFYDHPKGWFGVKKMVNPIETSRYALQTMGFSGNGTNIETTAKRVALSHLKKGLEKIYRGEITVIGNSHIRPHDLVYLGDVYSRMYGPFEAAQVIHHFTPETGFITSITPSACVSVNDPARFMMIARFKGQADIKSIRDAMRHKLNVARYNATGSVEGLTDVSANNELSLNSIIEDAEIQLQNSLQYTGGNAAIVTSMAMMAGIGGIVGGAVGAAAVGSGIVLGPLGAFGGWKAWKWVRDNLLDQQGAYIQFLTKNGRPMDAGLAADNSSIAVGHQNTRRIMFKGLKLAEIPVLGPDGSPKIRTQDVIPQLSWDETGPSEQARAVSLFHDRTNAMVRRIAGREFLAGGFDNEVYWVRITRVVDGDTFYVSVLGEHKYGEYAPGGGIVLGNGKIRPAGVDTPEDEFKTRSTFERSQVYGNDPGVRATEFARSLLMPGGQGIEVALRVDRANREDQFGRILAYTFHRAPEGLTGSDRRNFILNAATRIPPINYDSYMPDGQPYTFDWEMIAAGHGKVFTNDMKRDQQGRGASGSL